MVVYVQVGIDFCLADVFLSAYRVVIGRQKLDAMPRTPFFGFFQSVVTFVVIVGSARVQDNLMSVLNSLFRRFHGKRYLLSDIRERVSHERSVKVYCDNHVLFS